MADSIRDDIAAALDAPEAVETTPAANEPMGASPVEAIPASNEPMDAAQESGRVRDESGRFTKKAADKATTPAAPRAGGVKTDAAVLTPAVAASVPPVEASAPQVEALKPPQSWKPVAREDWAKLPPTVQQEVVRRERETAIALQEASEARKGYHQFREVVAPFEGMIRAEGGDPIRAVGSLLQTAAALRTAPPAHKAQLVAQMCQTYGIPIELLDQALAGQLPATNQPQAYAQQNQQQFRDPRLDKLIETAEHNRTTRMQKEIDAFSKSHEFFEDVRDDMAMLVDAAKARGIELGLEDAYNRAIQLYPEISGIVKQREAAQSAANAQASTQRSKAAASSVKSSPAAQVNGAQPTGLRDQLEAAFASNSGR